MARIDTDAVKHDHPVEETIARYGIELRPSGCGLLGRCPFHDDGGRPNLYVYPGTQSWYCYRCGVGGDVMSLVERIEGVGFRDAVGHLTGEHQGKANAATRLLRETKSRANGSTPWGPDERACLAAAVDLYHNRLLADPVPMAYLRDRGLDDDIIESCRLGYAVGNELVAYLRRCRLPIHAAARIGLLGRHGQEFLTGRIVVPEIRKGQPIWLVGRTIDPGYDAPKYLGLPGRKPLHGWEAAKDSSEVFLTEGVFDRLTLVQWGYPALALLGTQPRPDALTALGRFERVFLVLDNDDAGKAAAHDLSKDLGSRAVIVRLPGVKDVAELAPIPDGAHIFSRVVGQSDRARAA